MAIYRWGQSAPLSRRALLGATAALALASCSSLGLTSTQVQKDVAMIAAALSSLATAAAGLVPPDVLAKVQTIVASIEANAALVGQALTPSASLISQISSGISALAGILAPFYPMAPGIAAAVNTALALIGVVLTVTGVIPPAPTAALPSMSADDARAYLKRIAATGINPKSK